MATQTARFGPFLPDIPAFKSPGSAIIKNVMPIRGGYQPLREVVPVTEAVPEDVLAARFAKSSAGVSFGFAAAKQNIYKLTGNNFVSASRPGGYNTADDSTWFFARFGDLVLSTNFSNRPQQFDLSSDLSFSDFPLGAPNAKYMSLTRGFLVMGFLNEGGTLSPSGIRWSSINNPTSFPDIDILTNIRSDDAIQTLSDRQILSGDYGDVTGIVSGVTSADAVLFQESGLTAMNFTGGQEIFSLDVLEGARGCQSPKSILPIGGDVFYLSDAGLYVTDGISSEGFGASQVDDFILEAASLDRLADVQSGVDVRGKFAFWTLPAGNLNDDLALIYNYDTKEFSFAEGLGIGVFAQALSTGRTLEDIATQFGGLDAMRLPLDSPQFSGSGLPVFSAFNAENELGPMAGPALAASLRTAESEPIDDGRAYVQFTRPLVDTSEASVTPITRETMQQQPVEGVPVRVANGKALHRTSARYWALQVDIDAGANWTFAQGIQAIYEPAGNRDADDFQVTFTVPDFLLVKPGLLLLDDLGRPLVNLAPQGVVVDEAFLTTSDGDFIVTSDGDKIIVNAGISLLVEDDQ